MVVMHQFGNRSCKTLIQRGAHNTPTHDESQFNHIFIEFEKYMIFILLTDVQVMGFGYVNHRIGRTDA